MFIILVQRDETCDAKFREILLCFLNSQSSNFVSVGALSACVGALGKMPRENEASVESGRMKDSFFFFAIRFLKFTFNWRIHASTQDEA